MYLYKKKYTYIKKIYLYKKYTNKCIKLIILKTVIKLYLETSLATM